MHDVGHWGMKPLLGGSLKIGLEIALGSLLLAFSCVHSPLLALTILCSSGIVLGIIFVTSISGEVIC